MKKTIIAIIVIMMMGLTSIQAQNSGLFGRGNDGENSNDNPALLNRDNMPVLPGHDSNDDATAPLGEGLLLLMGMGAAYAVVRKRKK